MTGQHAVLVDTDIYSAFSLIGEQKARESGRPVDQWKDAVRGRRIVISFQTKAEVLVGATKAKWGPQRLESLREELNHVPVIQLDDEVMQAYVELSILSRDNGIALHQKVHTGDRWIAACARAKSIPLLSGDRIFETAGSLGALELIRIDL